jgi:hypothetical protein
MKQNTKAFQIINIIIGLLTLAGVAFDFVFFENVKDKMVSYFPITQQESNLLTVAGFSFLLMAGFFALSLLQMITSIRRSASLRFFEVLLFVVGMVALLMVFADISLLKDIVTQYEEGLSQPEWAILYPILIPQSFTVLVFVLLHILGFFTKEQTQAVVMDSNIFVLVQYTGLVCGVMGLAFTILGFIFPRGWSLAIHTVMTNMILIMPYSMVILYWFITKTNNKKQPLFDEKQRQDMGWSAFVTLIIVSGMLVLVFAINIRSLDGALRYLWLPLYLFSTILVFSMTNLYFNSKG